jgi:hypothetical protein
LLETKERLAWCRRDDEEQPAMVLAEEFHQKAGQQSRRCRFHLQG